MAGSREGGLITARKNKERELGFYTRIGATGGRNGNTGGFASSKVGEDGLTGRQRAKLAGKKGGTISRRRSK